MIYSPGHQMEKKMQIGILTPVLGPHPREDAPAGDPDTLGVGFREEAEQTCRSKSQTAALTASISVFRIQWPWNDFKGRQ